MDELLLNKGIRALSFRSPTKPKYHALETFTYQVRLISHLIKFHSSEGGSLLEVHPARTHPTMTLRSKCSRTTQISSNGFIKAQSRVTKMMPVTLEDYGLCMSFPCLHQKYVS